MDRFDREYLDVLARNVERAEESLKNATPERVDALLDSYISAKEEYYSTLSRLMH